MTSSEETSVFELLDSYSRSRHQCFVAEFFLNRAKTEYYACFRPTDVRMDSSNRYACRYLHIGLREATKAAENKELPVSLIELLDKELSTLGQLR